MRLGGYVSSLFIEGDITLFHEPNKQLPSKRHSFCMTRVLPGKGEHSSKQIQVCKLSANYFYLKDRLAYINYRPET